MKRLILIAYMGLALSCAAQKPQPATLATLDQSDPEQLRELGRRYWEMRRKNPELWERLDAAGEVWRGGR